MQELEIALAVFMVITALLIALVTILPGLTLFRGGRILLLLVCGGLPALATTVGLSTHLEKSKTTAFCLSCHVMEPYGASLWLDDSHFLPASHFQNNRVDPDRACFDCHTTYTLFGDFRAKLTGFQHLWVNYFGTIPEELELYRPYQNRECLHCHDGGRLYLEMHEPFLEELRAGGTSCLDCHDRMHAVRELEGLPTWTGPGR